MNVVHISKENQEQVFSILSAVLWLGNISFRIIDNEEHVEIVQDGMSGLLVPPRDPSALASAIIELLQNKTKAQRMGTEGRRVAEQNFNIQMNVNQIQELYFSLIKSNLSSLPKPWLKKKA